MINLVIPMAGRGSRFSKSGCLIPKPLIQLRGYPFFWWSIMSVIRQVDITSIICVVLKEHIEKFQIDSEVLKFFPEAQFVVLDDVTDGALDSAMRGLEAIDNNHPVLINDCDHAFEIPNLNTCLKKLVTLQIHGFICHFNSQSEAYSYAKFDEQGCLIETVEKKVISKLAIAGLYIFKNKKLIESYFSEYKRSCTYEETYISGLYNLILRDGKIIKGIELASHLSFGTPEELELAKKHMPYTSWSGR